MKCHSVVYLGTLRTFMYRTFVNRLCASQVPARLNLHLSAAGLAANKDTSPAKPSSSPDDEVLFERIRKTGVLRLNKPKALNALSLSMVNRLYPKMKVGAVAWILV